MWFDRLLEWAFNLPDRLAYPYGDFNVAAAGLFRPGMRVQIFVAGETTVGLVTAVDGGTLRVRLPRLPRSKARAQ